MKTLDFRQQFGPAEAMRFLQCCGVVLALSGGAQRAYFFVPLDDRRVGIPAVVFGDQDHVLRFERI